MENVSKQSVKWVLRFTMWEICGKVKMAARFLNVFHSRLLEREYLLTRNRVPHYRHVRDTISSFEIVASTAMMTVQLKKIRRIIAKMVNLHILYGIVFICKIIGAFLVSEKEFIHNTDEINEILDPATYENHRCVRECKVGAEPMVCEYTFHVSFNICLLFKRIQGVLVAIS